MRGSVPATYPFKNTKFASNGTKERTLALFAPQILKVFQRPSETLASWMGSLIKCTSGCEKQIN